MNPSPNNQRLVTSTAGLAELAKQLHAAGRFGFDTEFISESSFEPKLCLLQVATEEALALIDPLSVGDLDPFWAVLNDPSVEVVMHAAGEDLRISRLRTGTLPARVVDLQVAAGLVGTSYPLSLTNLARQELGQTLASGETRTDWMRRPLSDAQVRYALDDVRYLLPLADHLNGKLAAAGRLAWAEDEYRRLLEGIAARGDDQDRWRKLPGLHQLDRRGLEAARRLCEWRRQMAERGDRPIRHVLKDDLLVAIAKRKPRHKRDLEMLRDFNRPHLVAHANAFLQEVQAALALDEAQLPEHEDRRSDGPGTSMVVSLLAASLNQKCGEQQVAASLAGSQGDLRELVAWHRHGCPENERPQLARGWRHELCGAWLGDVLAGHVALRIVDPGSETPVSFFRVAPLLGDSSDEPTDQLLHE